MAEEKINSITWEAPEHRHNEKNSDWYWALGIITIAAATAAIMFGNTLFGIVIILGAGSMTLFSHRKPKIIPFEVSTRGIRTGGQLYPYSTLESFYIDEECPEGPQLLVQSEKLLMPIIVLPIPEEHVDDIDNMLSPRLPSEFLEEPFSERLLEFFGF